MTFFNVTFKKFWDDKNLHFCLKRKLPQTYTLITLGKFGNKFCVFFYCCDVFGYFSLGRRCRCCCRRRWIAALTWSLSTLFILGGPSPLCFLLESGRFITCLLMVDSGSISSVFGGEIFPSADDGRISCLWGTMPSSLSILKALFPGSSACANCLEIGRTLSKGKPLLTIYSDANIKSFILSFSRFSVVNKLFSSHSL